MVEVLTITVQDAREALKTINDLAIFAANHNVMTDSVPELVRVTDVLKKILASNKDHEVVKC